jgi:uncharacterized protein (DUF1684 family)
MRKFSPALPARPALVAALMIAAAAAGCSAPAPPDNRDYTTRVIEARKQKDDYLRTSPESPMTESGKKTMLPLVYYDVNPEYKVPAALNPSDDSSTIMIPTSAGTQDPFRKVGTLEFTVKGQTMRLTAYAPAASRTLDRLFVPFKDLTSEKDTYGGGRYLDLDRTATGLYEMDFNLAYTPNCYYNPTWICPLPPRENHLAIAIEAGEKVRS